MPPAITAPAFRNPQTGRAFRYRLTPIDITTGEEIRFSGNELNRYALECPECWALVREPSYVQHVKAVHPPNGEV